MRQNGVFYLLHGDHLGSTRLVTDAPGYVYSTEGRYAYGRLYWSGGSALPTDHKFTGQKLDATGLMYFNARYYDPKLGQFLSPDTLVPDPGKLFDYNRYMYVRGNPMMYNDPTGHYSNDEIKQYLQDNYGDAWQDYWQAWQADPYWMWVLGAAHDNYTLITGLGGSVKFTAKAGSFALSHGQLHEYQGQGVYTVLDDNTGVVGDSEWLGYGSESGVWGIFTQLFRQGMYQYYQPIYNYSGGSPSFSHWQMITVNNSVEANILAGDNTPYLLGAIGEAIKRRWPQALGGAVGAGLQVWSVYTTIDDLAVYKADSVQYQSVGQYWQSPGVSADGKPVPVPAPHPWANPNGPQWPGPLE